MASWRFEVGSRVSDWMIRRRLATGGNGEVYEVEHPSGATGALKCLRRSAQGSGLQARFLREIEAMVACQDLPGVLKVLDSAPGQRDPVAWYVMELARTFDKRLRAMGFTEVVAASPLSPVRWLRCTSAATRIGMSSRRTSSGADGKWKVGDFGLVAHRQQARLTTTNKKLGPIYYLAPEMLLDPLSAEGAPAGVFSLAKVLWVALAGQRYPMPGHLHRDFELMRLSSWVTGLKAQKLDAVLHAATVKNQT